MSWCGPQPAGDNQLMEDVQPFKFGQSEPQAPVVLSGMDRIGERMARRIRAVLEPMTGMKPRVNREAVSVYSFSHWCLFFPLFVILHVYRVHPDWKNVRQGKSVAVAVDLGGRRIMK